MMRLQYRVADILPAPPVLKSNAVVQFNLLQHRLRHVRILVQRHVPSLPNRKITVSDPEVVWIIRNTVPVHGIVLAFREPHLELNGRVRLRRLAQRPDDREPIADRFAGKDSYGRDGRDAD